MDLLNTMGKKPTTSEPPKQEPTSATQPTKLETNIPPVAIKHSDMLSQATGTGTTGGVIAETKTTEPAVEPPKPEPVSDPDSWTKDSAFKEVKRLREENKTYRLKYEEKLDKLKSEAEQRIQAKEQELATAKAAQLELDEIKAKEADKERNLTEKLAHREALATEYKMKLETQKSEFESKLKEAQSQLDRYHADIEAQKEIAKEKLQKELVTIPEKFKDVADLIVKGAGDERSAIVAISEAKLKGVFEDKTVIVNHSVPGAHDGARATNERLAEAAKAERNKMSPSQKISSALKDIRAGHNNPAFRLNK